MTNPLSHQREAAARPATPSSDSHEKHKIALLCGGTSNEREISLASARNVEQALGELGHEVINVDTADPRFLTTLIEEQPDVAFIALHGKGGEDGTLQGVLDLMGIPYTGSGVLGSALAMDKHRTKVIYESLGLKTAPWVLLKSQERAEREACLDRISTAMELPVVVKPVDDGSSVGITIVKTKEALPKALEDAFDAGGDVLVERFIAGTEITVSVLGAGELQTLPAIEIVPKNEFYDYESKYAEGGSVHIIPARITEELGTEASKAAIQAHRGLDCYGVSRTDMIIDGNDDIWIIETNTIPGMTGTSLLPDAAQHVGISNHELYSMLIGWALERSKAPSKH